jgi:hypothetical protein
VARVSHLVDPNPGLEMYDLADIVAIYSEQRLR